MVNELWNHSGEALSVTERSLGRSDKMVFGTTLVAAIAAVGFLGFRMIHRSQLSAIRAIPPDLRRFVLPEDARNRSGKAMLIEFGDYECPPCRALHPEVAQILESAKQTLDFRFRNYPLREIHPTAYRLAVIGEVARARGLHTVAHNLLYTQIDGKPLVASLRKIGIDSDRLDGMELRQARALVDRDLIDAKKLDLPGTPTFIILRQNGQADIVPLDSVKAEFAPNLR